MSYEHQARIRWSFTTHPANDMFGEEEPAALKELDRIYAQAAKTDEYEANLKEVRKQLKIEIRLARRSGDNAEGYAFSEALEMIEKINVE